ncbi:MAG: protein-ADP-ribose hydrolase [Synergistaceae bacterium]|nr:protein-ADP-ribose hydrolase [Synergistaceae bacterium]
MNDKISYLTDYLLDEMPEYKQSAQSIHDPKMLLRSLMNVRPPMKLSPDFLKVQDEYLSSERESKGVVDVEALPEILPHISLWQGDITRLKADAIVNAANSELLGCFIPCHRCIDNAIHSAAGLQLRDECYHLMTEQGHDEPTGSAKITKGYNLPAKHVIHTVGPIVRGKLTGEHRKELESCYRSCLELAENEGLKSIALCCISTGEFHFPNDEAASIAVRTVRDFLMKAESVNRVVFNVFKASDMMIYRRELAK